MGNVSSKEKEERLRKAVEKLSKVELCNIEEVFGELSSINQFGEKSIQRPSWLTRDTFAEKFGLPDLLGEQLFAAFDRDGNGQIDVDEFVSGMALCLHGSVQDKCRLLFNLFDLNGDEGISREELTTVLNTALSGARVVTNAICKSEPQDRGKDISLFEDMVSETVRIQKIVDDAFETCDLSKNGKLENEEFARWVMKNSKLVKSFVMIQCPLPSGDASKQPVETAVETSEESDDIVVISPGGPLNPKVTLTEDDPLQELQGVATLSDLFTKSELSPVRDKEGQHFFDSLSGLEGTESVPLSEATSVENLADQEQIMDDSMSNLFLDSKSSVDTTGKTDSPSEGEVFSDAMEEGPSECHQETRSGVDEDSGTLHDTRGRSGSSSGSPVDDAPPAESEKNSLALHAERLFGAATSDDYFGQLIGKPTLKELARRSQENLLSQDRTPSPDLDNIVSLWPQTTQTKQLIDASLRGTEIDTVNLTYPYVMVDMPMGDPVKELVVKFFGEQEALKRPIPTAETVTMNDAGLMDLLNAKCWRGAVDFTAKYLTGHGQGPNADTKTKLVHTPKTLQVWLTRSSLLFKLRMFSSVDAELNAFAGFDKPDLFFEFFPHVFPGRKGSIVPFSLRVIHAEVPQHNGRPNESLDRLYGLLYAVHTVIKAIETENYDHISGKPVDRSLKDAALRIWENRVVRILYSVGNCLLGMKEYDVAAKVFGTAMEKCPDSKPSLLSGIGRLHLQLGDTQLAQRIFKKVEQVALGDPKTLSLVVMNKGFYAMSQGRYQEAYDHFLSVTKLDPDNASAYNNASVCLLFLGRVKEACTLLETLIWRSPPKNIHEDVLFNLCTIYELETSRAHQKKQKLLDLVSRHMGDGFNVQCLKLN